MWIHFSENGIYESFSNSNAKNVKTFLERRECLVWEEKQLNLKNIGMLKNIQIYLDIESFLHMVNLDCKSCDKLFSKTCDDNIYPFEILMDMDEHFQVQRLLLFVDTEDTRLISIYGKHGHLNHCIDSNLSENPFNKYSSQNDCNKKKYFKQTEYDYAYVFLKSRIENVLNKDIYNTIKQSLEKYLDDSKKIGSLF